MAPPSDDKTRRLVAERAGHRCEYCLLHEDDSFSRHQVDHIVSRKHGGASDVQNLAFACVRCNAWKGTDIAGIDHRTGDWRDRSILAGSAGPITFGLRVSSLNR